MSETNITLTRQKCVQISCSSNVDNGHRFPNIVLRSRLLETMGVVQNVTNSATGTRLMRWKRRLQEQQNGKQEWLGTGTA